MGQNHDLAATFFGHKLVRKENHIQIKKIKQHDDIESLRKIFDTKVKKYFSQHILELAQVG